ncbi:MAG: hypothetical protein ACRERE_28490 [Candidatus Entotheonellia bacterium]|jgi:hypothetical protein
MDLLTKSWPAKPIVGRHVLLDRSRLGEAGVPLGVKTHRSGVGLDIACPPPDPLAMFWLMLVLALHLR